MATVTKLTSVSSTTFNDILTTSAVITAAIGDYLVVVLAATNAMPDGSSSFLDLVDSDGINTYTVRAHINNNREGSSNLGTTLVLATCAVTDTLTSATISANFDPASAGAGTRTKAMTVYRIQSAGTISYVTADATGQTGNDTLHAANTVSVVNGNIIFGAAALETGISITGDTDTLNGSWSAVETVVADPGSTDDINQSCVSQYKTVTATGNQSWSCSTTTAKDSARSYVVIKPAATAFSLATAQGGYNLSGTAATLRLGIPPLVAGVGSYALTGTDTTPEHGWLVTAAPGSYVLTGTDAGTLHGWVTRVLSIGGYALFGTDASPFKTPVAGQALPAGAGSYVLTGQDASLLHGWLLAASAGSYALSGTAASPLQGYRLDATVAGSYVLTGSAVSLNATTGNKTLIVDSGTYLLTGTAASTLVGFRVAADPGSYALTGTPATLTASVPATPPIRAMGEPPIARERRRRNEAERARALEQQRKARDRLKRAIGRLLEGLPPEFDAPEELAQAEENAVEARNLLYAMSAPIREINAVNELISTIHAMRVAKPIVQLELARAYNQAYRHLIQKAQEDVAMTLLLGE